MLTTFLGACSTTAQHPAIVAPRPTSATETVLTKTDVDVRCLQVGIELLCTVDAKHRLENRGARLVTPALSLVTREVSARSTYIEGRVVEPFQWADELSSTVPVPPSSVTNVTTRAEVSLHRNWSAGTITATDEPVSLWRMLHPVFGTDREVHEYWPIRYCFLVDTFSPAIPVLRDVNLPPDLVAARRWEIDDHPSAEDCPAISGGRVRAAVLEIHRDVPLVTNGGPVVSGGYVFGEGWAAELGYDVAVWRYFAVEASLHLDRDGERMIVPLVGLPLTFKLGVPIRFRPDEKIGYRLQVDAHFSNQRYLAPGLLYYLEYFPGDGLRFGLMGSVAL